MITVGAYPYCKWPDAQGCFKRHTKTNGIHKKPMENYESFLRELYGKQETVNMQVTKPTQKSYERNKNVLLSIIDIIKTIGKMGIALRGHRDDSKYHPDIGQPSGHREFGNFVELDNLKTRQGNTSLEKLKCPAWSVLPHGEKVPF